MKTFLPGLKLGRLKIPFRRVLSLLLGFTLVFSQFSPWLPLFGPPPAQAAGTTYYVDATGGSDSNPGTSITTPWQTVAKVNAASLAPGDYIYFKRGETWVFATSTDRLIARSGVTYGAYGSGNLPIIDGNGVSDGMLGMDVNNVRVEDIKFTNCYDACAQFIRTNNVSVVDSEMSGAGNDNLLFITDNTNVTVSGGKYYDPVRRVAGPQVTNIEIANGGSNFTIDGVELYGAENAGISIHNHTGTDVPTNITINNVYSHNNTGHGIQILTQDETQAVDIDITNSRFISNNTGVRVFKSGSYYIHGDVLVDKNVFGNNSAYGFFVEGDDVTIQRSTFYGTNQAGQVSSAKNFTFQNNTTYLSPSNPIWMLFVSGGTRVDGISAKNNIFYMTTTSGQFVGSALNSSTNMVVDYNQYYFSPYAGNARWMKEGTAYNFTNWQTVVGNDTHGLGPTSDPLFNDPSVYDFTLQADSPAIGAGMDVGLAFNGDAPDIGAYEYVYAPAAPSSLAQYKSNGTTVVPTNGLTNENSVVLKLAMSSVNAADSLTPQVEIREVGTAFSNAVTHSGPAVAFSGTPVTGTAIVSGLTNGRSYHWQARANNSAGAGAWVLGGTFTVDTATPSFALTKIGTLNYQSGINTYYYTGSKPTFSGTGEAGAAITLKVGGTTRATGTISANGSWSLGGYTFSAGSHTAQITATDAAGNQTAAAFTLVISPDWSLFPSWLVTQLTGEELYPAEEGPLPVEEEKPPEEEEPAVKGNTVTVRLADQKGKPLAGIWVTLASEPQTAQTDANGEATFTNVTPGEHTLSFEYGGEKVERTLNLLGDEQDYKLDVTVEGVPPEGYFFGVQWYLWLLFGGIGALVLVMILRKVRR
ncbi:hypothetical protein GTO10_01845 [Candidatus Saccharibacteria bacterium]|nr:hypothetical protein [Candidatus Saccharibacteria bacterium]